MGGLEEPMKLVHDFFHRTAVKSLIR